MALALWFLGLVAFVVAAAVASGRGRATPNDVVGRRVVASAALAYVALVVSAVWMWSGAPATHGRADQLRGGASVSLTLLGVRMPLAGPISIGHGPDVDVRMPGGEQGVLARIELEPAEPPRAVVRTASRDVVVAPVALGADPAAVATTRGCAPDPAAFTLPAGATVVVIECAEGRPVRALAAIRDPSAARLRFAPLAWRGRFVPERLTVRAGDAMRVGGEDALPGVNTWDAIALRGSTAMLAVPENPTDCAAWSPELGGARETRDGCEVDTGAFAVAALPLVPDAASVIDRAARAAFAIAASPLALLLSLAFARRRGRRVHALARTLRLCVLGVGLTALMCWRLLWAYRIDVLRELASVGPRLLGNQLAVAAIGATLAGLTALALESHDHRSVWRRAGIALAAWATWLVVAWLAVGLGAPRFGFSTVGVLGLSLAAAWTPLATEIAARFTGRLGPELALAGIASAAVVARLGAPRSTLLKLGLAYAAVLAGHAALRVAVAGDTRIARRAWLVGLLGAAAFALASLDAGVTLAITGTGLALAMLVAGHDATYDASQAERVGLLEREHARLLRVHGVATIALAIGVAAVALTASDRALLLHGTTAVLHAPLVIAVLFGFAAVVARSHRRGWAPWLAAALAALAVWGARDHLLERATSGTHTSARRVSAIVEPGYALLRDQRAFAANVSAWREAALAPGAEVDHWHGQGYFGARVRDPGVSRSIDNDYLPVLVAREGGVVGLTQGVALLLILVVGAGAIASVRMRHASREHRARWLVTAVAGSLALYQPLAALGVLPLTGISWPGLGIDSPADLWLFVIGAIWCLIAGERAASDDERVRQTPRLARARNLVIVALAVAGLAAAIVVARAGACALTRVTTDDQRVETALAYAGSLRCGWPERTGATVEDVIPAVIGGDVRDGATGRFELELRAAWRTQRPALVRALTPATAARSAELAPADESTSAPVAARAPAQKSKRKRGDAQPQDRATKARGRSTKRDAQDADEKASASKGDGARSARDGSTERDKRSAKSGAAAVEGSAGSGASRRGDAAATEGSGASRRGDATAAEGSGASRRGDVAAAAGSGASRRGNGAAAEGSGASRNGAAAGAGTSRPDAADPASAGRGSPHPATPDGSTDEPEDDLADETSKDHALPAPPALLASECRGRVGQWTLARDGEECVAKLRVGWPEIRVAIRPEGDGVRATCRVVRDDDAISALRAPVHTQRAPRIRVVSAAMGAAATDVGELVAGTRVVRMRAGAPSVELAGLGAGLHPAAQVAIGGGVTVEVRDRGVVLRGRAELFVAGEASAWRRLVHADEVALDRLTLIVAGPPDRRAIALFRPPRAWGDAQVVDPLLADDTNRVGDRARRAYPYGAALAELGWVNPYDVDRSLGLDGWIHAAHARPDAAPPAAPAMCGTLSPPTAPRERVCAPNPHDGVLECRVSLQPELALSLRRIIDGVLADPKPHTGRAVHPVRASYVVMRGDTGELLAQGNVVPGRPALAYAPTSPDAEAALIRLREARGESDRERVEWNLPIAVGSTLKPILARAAEHAFPHDVPRMTFTAAGQVAGCKARRGQSVTPIVGHCPPTPVAGQPTTADLHDFLARSPNWYQATLGLVGLALPDGKLTAGDAPVSLDEIAASDLTSWPTEASLGVSDPTGLILGKRTISVDGLRRTPLWNRVERLLGRPLCTLGDRASCERAAARADVCAARALPLASPGADLRYLVALGPDRIDPYADDRARQAWIPIREYLQLLRGSGVHPVGSLAQITDAFGRVVYDPGAERLAASWFPAPVAGVTPDWSCASATGRAATVLGADGGLCGVVRPGGTAHATAGVLLGEPNLVVYGAKTGTTDSLAGIARRPAACRAWNERRPRDQQLECGKTPPDDSLFVIAFGVVTPSGTIPITLGIQLQRAGSGAASRTAPQLVREIARYLRGEAAPTSARP
ncbi:MAG: hypothetical protein ACTHU0_29555 [Kofleriaceae bacterium]